MRTLGLRGLLTALLLLSGCTVLQIGGGVAPDPAVVEKLRQEIPTYDEAQLADRTDYIRAGSVEAYLCRRSLLTNITDDEVVGVLRQKAYDAGANGLTDVSCGPGPTNELGACMMSIACSATLVKTVASGSAGK